MGDDISVLIDSGIFIAYYNKRDENHEQAVELIKQIEDNKLGAAYVTDHVFDETVTYLQKRVSEKDAVKVGQQILDCFQFIFTMPEMFSESWELFRKNSVSFTDCSLVVIKRRWKIDHLITFDKRLNDIIRGGK